MSKKVKNLIEKETANRLKGIDAVAVINPRGINAIKNNQIRRKLREKGLRMTVVKNTLAKRAIGEGSKLKGFDRLLDGPSAVIYGQASISTIAPWRWTSPCARSNDECRWVRNRSMAFSFRRPITLSQGPHIPTSVMYAVPPRSTRSSAVWMCVCEPSTALTRPSR